MQISEKSFAKIAINCKFSGVKKLIFAKSEIESPVAKSGKSIFTKVNFATAYNRFKKLSIGYNFVS